jgi:hypothetical protein
MSYTMKLLLKQIYQKLRYIVSEKRQYLKVRILQFLELCYGLGRKLPYG